MTLLTQKMGDDAPGKKTGGKKKDEAWYQNLWE